MSALRVTTDERGHAALRLGAAVFVVGYFAHFADHWALGWDRTPEAVLLSGSAGFVAFLAVAALILRRDPLAPALAVALGVPFALGYPIVHIPPKWGALSEPYRAGIGVLDWASVGAAFVGGAALAAAGAYAYRRGVTAATEPAGPRARPPTRAAVPRARPSGR